MRVRCLGEEFSRDETVVWGEATGQRRNKRLGHVVLQLPIGFYERVFKLLVLRGDSCFQ